MRVSAHENVAVELPLHGRKRLQVAPRHDLVPVYDADLEVADRDELGFGQASNLRGRW